MKNYRTLLIVVPRLVSYLGFLRELCGTLIADRAEVHVACSPAPLGDEEIASAEDGVQLHHIEFPRGMNPAGAPARRTRELACQNAATRHCPSAFFSSDFHDRAGITSRWPVTHATFHGVSFRDARLESLLLRAWNMAARSSIPSGY
jgi:hypothetical protein